jgi:lysyl-tRNA synthetase class 2
MEIRMTEYDTRKQKIQTLRTLGINPFVQRRDKKYSIWSLLTSSVIPAQAGIYPLRTIEEILQWPTTPYSTAGRLMLKRVAGKLAFWQIMDETGTIQIMREHQNSKLIASSWTERSGVEGSHSKESNKMLRQAQHDAQRQELLWESTKSFDYWFVDKMLDIGDFVGIRGELFMTHKGELTLFVSEYQLLSKAVRPLGDKFHGIGEDNAETAYRQRYLDMIFNSDSLQRMKLRSRFLKVIRDFYDEHGFIEIETPVLGNSASGAAAAPFMTHHNDFDQDMYLRISPETNLKKATVGMLEKIFEVAKDFRNEGSDPSHIQEFTMIEHYAAYRNHEDNMSFTEQMFDYIFEHIPELKKAITVIDKNGIEKEVSFQTPRQRIDYISQIKQDSGIDVSQYTADDEAQLRTDIKAKGHHREWLDTQGTATMIDYLYKKVTRPQIVGPAFIVNYPKTMQPLARQSDTNPNIVEQRQLLINGREVIKAYCELVDPIQQQANFDEQAGAVAKWDDEATKSDDDFVKAMEYGMPPQSGRGMGIDRIFSLLTEQSNIRDVVLFPLVKTENKE